MKTPNRKKIVMIIAGEASGDMHGANLVKAINKRNANILFYGIGGEKMRKAGVKILMDASKLAVVGITEVLRKAPDVIKGLITAKGFIKSKKPDLIIPIDFPDFNFKLLKTAKKENIKVLYYISPQIWAWRPGRVKKIIRLVDHMAVILPFEAKFYEEHDMPVTYVGHPLLDDVSRQGEVKNKIEPRKEHDDFAILGLLPGSRQGEISRHLPIMMEAALLLAKKNRKIRFAIPLADKSLKNIVEIIVSKYKSFLDVDIVLGGANQVLKKCDFAVVASGTVTLESAIIGTPMVIIYKVSPITYWLGKHLIKVKYIGIVNLIAGREIAPEFIQKEANPDNIAQKVTSMLNDKKELAILKQDLLNVKDSLGQPGASKKVAGIALEMLKN